MRTIVLLVAAGAACSTVTSCTKPPPTRTVLEAQTRELLAGIAKADRGPWERLADPSLLYASEDNKVLSKSQMMEQITPLPKGVSATIVPANFKVADHGDFAVTTYVAEERPTFYGQNVPANYRVTDTWQKTRAGWKLVASEVFAIPFDPPATQLSTNLLRQYVGRYQLTDGKFYTVSLAGDQLSAQRNGRAAETLTPEAPDVFFIKGNPRYRYVFVHDAQGHVAMLAQRREGADLIWKRVD